MSTFASNVVVGLGEVGQPLFEIIVGVRQDAIGIDPGKGRVDFEVDSCDFLHICIPGGLPNFVSIIDGYLEKIETSIVIVHSTVPPGTTRKIAHPHPRLFHSPVNGKHAEMGLALLRHPKFVSCPAKDNQSRLVKELFSECGLQFVYITGGTETTELGKILATTAYGYNIAWAQEVERICAALGVGREESAKMCYELIESSDFTMKGKYSGVIAGHCVTQNIELLRELGIHSDMLEWVISSNERKKNGC